MDNRLYRNHIELDYLDRGAIESIQCQLLKGVMEKARSHPLFPGLPPLPAAWDQRAAADYLEAIPPSVPQDHAGMLAAMTGSRILFSSSGSTGSPKLVGLSFDEVLRNTRFHGKGYQAVGITPSDRVATFGLPGLMNSEFTVYLGLSRTGCMIVPLGALNAVPDVIAACRRLEATVLLVMPSTLASIINELETTGARLPLARLVVCGGEPTWPELRDRATVVLGDGGLRVRGTFQTSQAGTIGFQCPYLASHEYHVHEELQLLQIDADTQEVITTNLDRLEMPVVRMKTGDRAEFASGGCPCGRTLKTIRFLGRTARLVKVGGELVDPALFSEAAEKVGLASDEWGVSLDRNPSNQDALTVMLDGRTGIDSLGARFRKALLESSAKIAQQIQAGVIADVSFRRLEARDRRKTGSGKALAFDDRRA